MKPLTEIEKISHSESLTEYINHINNNLNPRDSLLNLVQLSYGIPVNQYYYYFDCPYFDNLVSINDYLAKSNYDIHFFNAMRMAKGASINSIGYIHFDVAYDYINSTIYLSIKNENIIVHFSKDGGEAPLKYLSMIYSCIDKDASHLADVKFISDCPAIEKYNIRSFVITCEFDKNLEETYNYTYESKPEYFLSEIEFAQKVKEYQKFVQIYFRSPINEKLIQEKRKSTIQSLRHEVGGLFLNRTLKKIRKNLLGGKSDTIKYLEVLETKLRRLHLFHFLILKAEAISIGSDKDDINFELNVNSLASLLTYFKEHLELPGKTIELKINGYDISLDNDNQVLKIQALHKLCLVLWNLWKNCSNFPDSTVELIENDQNIDVVFSNSKCMKKEFVSYINEKNKVYPKSAREDKYRGLAIVKDICQQKNWPLECRVNSIQKSTTVNLTLNESNLFHINR